MTDTIKISRDCPLCGGAVQFHRDEECSGCHCLCCQRCLTTFDLSLGVDAHNECSTLYELQLRIADAWNQRTTNPADATDMGGQAGEDQGEVQRLREALEHCSEVMKDPWKHGEGCISRAINRADAALSASTGQGEGEQ